MTKKYISISEVKGVPINRLSTGSLELDWMYGTSCFGSPACYQSGMPSGTISNWIGEAGVGKSRMAIAVSKRVVKNGGTVLYFQNEVEIPTFANWVNNSNTILEKFYCSSVTSLSEQLEIIREVAPDVVFVDSINLLDEFKSGTASDIKSVVDGFREVIKETGSHVIFLCQLNKDGSAKGSSALTHLSDINFVLTRDPLGFRISVGAKHRYGKTGPSIYGIWKHTSTGVERVSNNRCLDTEWCLHYTVDAWYSGSGKVATPNEEKDKEDNSWDIFYKNYQKDNGKNFRLKIV